MPRPAPPPELVSRAVAAVRAGASYRDVADELAREGKAVSHQTIRRWCAAAGVVGVEPMAGRGPEKTDPVPAKAEVSGPVLAAPSPPPPSLAAALAANPPAEAEDDRPDPSDLEASIDDMIKRARVEAHNARANPKAVAQWARQQADLLKVKAQLEKRKPADPDVLQFSRAEIAKALESRAEAVKAMCASGLRCVDCGRELRIKWSRGEGLPPRDGSGA